MPGKKSKFWKLPLYNDGPQRISADNSKQNWVFFANHWNECIGEKKH